MIKSVKQEVSILWCASYVYAGNLIVQSPLLFSKKSSDKEMANTPYLLLVFFLLVTCFPLVVLGAIWAPGKISINGNQQPVYQNIQYQAF
jgi:hypothetical protein